LAGAATRGKPAVGKDRQRGSASFALHPNWRRRAQETISPMRVTYSVPIAG